MSIIRTNSTILGGLTTLAPRLLYFTTSGTPATATKLTVAISGTAANVGATVTFTSTKAHGVILGQTVVVSGAAHTFLNGTFVVATVTSDKIFTYTLSATQANQSDSASVTYGCKFQTATIIADAGNGASVSFGPSSDADQDVIAAGKNFAIIAPSGAVHDLSEWYIKSANASQNVRIAIQ